MDAEGRSSSVFQESPPHSPGRLQRLIPAGRSNHHIPSPPIRQSPSAASSRFHILRALGHTLHQDLTFKADAGVRRAAFIASSVEVRNEFAFAAPTQVLKAVRILCCSAYGAVLWRLSSFEASSFFKAYSSCVRRIWQLPLDTYTYLVEGHLSDGVPPLRNMVLSRYSTFYQNMLRSPCSEVTVLAELISKDARSTTAGNLAHVSAITGLNCSTAGKIEIKAALPITQVPDDQKWRLGLLDSLLRERSTLLSEGQDAKCVISMISSLCNT